MWIEFFITTMEKFSSEILIAKASLNRNILLEGKSQTVSNTNTLGRNSINQVFMYYKFANSTLW